MLSTQEVPLSAQRAPAKRQGLWGRLWRALQQNLVPGRLTDAQHNERMLYLEAFFQSIAGAGAFAFVAVFLVRLGAPNWVVGLHTSLPALITILAILPMGALVRRQRDLIRTVNTARMIYRTVSGSYGLLVYLPAAIAPLLLVVIEGLLAIPGAVVNIAQTTILGRATTNERRPSMLSIRMAVNGLMGALVGVLAGQWLDAVAYPLNYQLLFASVFFAGIGNVVAVSRLKLPQAAVEQAAARARVGLRQMFGLFKSTPAFYRFSVAAFIFRVGLNLPAALYAIYRVRTIGASDAWIGLLLMIERFLSVFTYLLLSRLLSRAHTRRWLWASSLGMALFPLAMAWARTPEQLILSAVIGGLFAPGVDIFMTDTLFCVSPDEERPSFVAANTLLANITAFASPLIGTFLADWITIRTALAIAAALRIAGGLAFWRLGVGRER